MVHSPMAFFSLQGPTVAHGGGTFA